MTALLAIVLGFTAVGYAAWPWLIGGGTVRPLKAAAADFDPSLESQLAALRAWSIAACELPARPATDEPASADPAKPELKASE